MIFHPPAMYVGYVGVAVPFAFALAALVTGRVEGWTAAVRSWALVAWIGLGLGLLLGMRWAYDVLGWGGYWAWDPVENAGLMPWLTMTAFLHGAAMQDERRGFQGWSFALIVASFVLVLFGTFATRSGLIQSVHAYARSDLGTPFMAAIVVTLAGSLALLLWRRGALAPAPAQTASPSLLSREGMFFLTLVLFATLTLSVFVGSVLPTLTSWIGSRPFEAGPAWFDRVTGPQFAALLLLLGLCPLVGRSATLLQRLQSRGWPIFAGTTLIIGATALAGFTQPAALIGIGLVGLAGSTALLEYALAIKARRDNTGESPFRALGELLRRQPRRYAGYLVHLGVVLMGVGIIGTRLYPLEQDVTLTWGRLQKSGTTRCSWRTCSRSPSMTASAPGPTSISTETALREHADAAHQSL
jgi:cytochrome c-type biogenesis protein CcmF